MVRCVSCKHAAYCRRHLRIRLVHKDVLHPSMWINPHIHTKYRPVELPWLLCAKSIFHWNNETLNVWSHLLGFVYIGVMQYWCAFRALPQVSAPSADYIVMAGSMTCSQICLALSAAYHTFGCHSIEHRLRWLRADLFGISLALLGIYLSGIYTSFYKFPEIQKIYSGCLAVILAISLSVPFFTVNETTDDIVIKKTEKVMVKKNAKRKAKSIILPASTIETMRTTVNYRKPIKIESQEERDTTVTQQKDSNRMASTSNNQQLQNYHSKDDDKKTDNSRRIGATHFVYIALALFGLYPTWHWIELHGGISNPHVLEWLPTLVTLFALLGMAFLFYATLIPERFFPGKFDVVGCSHQWWHVLILAAMVYWHNAGVRLLAHYHSQQHYIMENDIDASDNNNDVYHNNNCSSA